MTMNMTAATKIGIIGASGRMGQCLYRAFFETLDKDFINAADFTLSAMSVRNVNDTSDLKAKPGATADIIITDDPDVFMQSCDIAIDFTRPSISKNYWDAARKHGTKMVIGTTGFSDDDKRAMQDLAKDITILYGTNMSLGINLLQKILTMITPHLADFDMAIHDIHHRHKQDHPSGTALSLAASMAAALGGKTDDLVGQLLHNTNMGDGMREHHGVGRKSDSAIEKPLPKIQITAQRIGNVPGTHEVHFSGMDEELSLVHKSHDRMIFARGAIKAAIWLAKQNKPGLYGMQDILAL